MLQKHPSLQATPTRQRVQSNRLKGKYQQDSLSHQQHSIATNHNDVSDEEVTRVPPKRKSMKSVSGDGDVSLVKKSRKSKVMNKRNAIA